MPINNMDSSFHIIVVRITCLTNHMGCISPHITTLVIVINSLEGGDTHTHTHKHTDVHTETVLRDQANLPVAGAHLV